MLVAGKYEGGPAGDKVVELAVDELGRLILSPNAPASPMAVQAVAPALAALGVPRVAATGTAAVAVVLTPTCTRISMYATQGAWYAVSGTASAASHYIAAGERLDFAVPAGTTLSLLQETTAGSVRISELA